MSQFHNGHQAETALKSTHCVCKIKAKSLNKSDKNGVKIHEIQMWLPNKLYWGVDYIS